MHTGKYLIPQFYICFPGLLHESQNKSSLAERAFLEARSRLRAEEAKRQTQKEEEKDERKETESRKDQQEEQETSPSACQSPTINPGDNAGGGNAPRRL